MKGDGSVLQPSHFNNRGMRLERPFQGHVPGQDRWPMLEALPSWQVERASAGWWWQWPSCSVICWLISVIFKKPYPTHFKRTFTDCMARPGTGLLALEFAYASDSPPPRVVMASTQQLARATCRGTVRRTIHSSVHWETVFTQHYSMKLADLADKDLVVCCCLSGRQTRSGTEQRTDRRQRPGYLNIATRCCRCDWRRRGCATLLLMSLLSSVFCGSSGSRHIDNRNRQKKPGRCCAPADATRINR